MSSRKAFFLAGAFLLALQGSAFAQFLPVFPNESGSDRASGWTAGAHVGRNWQRGWLVYGLEADVTWTDLETEINKGFSGTGILPPGVPLPSAHTSANLDWYSTIRGRLGWTNGPALFYGTAGLAFGRVELASTFDLAQFSGAPVLNSQMSQIKSGWVVGAGVDYLLSPNLILKLGYQYVDLGTAQIVDTQNAPFVAQTVSAHAAFHEVRAGLSWRFGPETGQPTGPWDGWYAGAHGGGAWGLKTEAEYSSTPAVSDARLKRDVTLIGRRADGLGIYRYRYLWSDTVYAGVMAQEVALLRPDAIVRSASDDYLRVDYSRLGMQLVTLSH